MLRILALIAILCPMSLYGQGTPLALDIAVETAGPLSTGAQWATRVTNANIIDLLSHNPMTSPVLAPGNPIGWSLGNFYRLRWKRAASRLSAGFPANTGSNTRLTHLYASSWILEDGRSTWGIDVVEGPFGTFGFAGSIGPVEITAMCNELDALFITHLDSDHFSIPMVTEMLVQGKPVICPPDLAGIILFGGGPPGLVIVPPNGLTRINTPNGKILFDTYNGSQRGGTPSQVDCNAYRFRMINDKSCVHAGDVDDSNFQGYTGKHDWFADYLLNPGSAVIPYDYRFLTHELEYTHFGLGLLHLNMPTTWPPPKSRVVLIWGESIIL